MRDHDHHGSGQVGAEHADAGQAGHETGHGALRWRLRRVLKGGLRGLAEGLLSDDLHRLGEQIQCLRGTVMEDAAEVERLQGELKDVRAELAAGDSLCALLAAKRRAAYEERDQARAETNRLQAEVERLTADLQAATAKLDDESIRVGRLQARVGVLDLQVYNAGQENDRLRKDRDALRRRLAGPATMPTRDTDSTGQKVVTSDGRRAGGCWWTCRHGKRCTKGSGHDGDHDYQGCACASPDAWCGRCDTPLGRRPTQGEVNVTCSGCGAVVTLTPPHDSTGEG